MSLGQCNPQGKLLWHLDRISEWQTTGKTSPIVFEIDPSNKCNQDCPWCSFRKLRSESNVIMCWETMRNLLENMKRMGVKAINWTGGGEPMINPHFLDGVKYAEVLGFDQGIFTNGQLLTPKKADVMAELMTWIRFSLDAGCPEDYTREHGTTEKAFFKVIENIKYLCSIRDRCTVGVGFIITKENYEGIEKATRIAKKAGADYIQLKPVAYRPGEEQMNPQFIRTYIMPQVNLATFLGDKNFNVMVTGYRFDDMMSPEGNYGRNYKKCLSHHFQGAVGADSKVYLCDHHKGVKEYELGDLTENSLKEIWASDKRKKCIERLDNTDLSQCQICCRNHETNKFLWNVVHPKKEMHPNHI